MSHLAQVTLKSFVVCPRHCHVVTLLRGCLGSSTCVLCLLPWCPTPRNEEQLYGNTGRFCHGLQRPVLLVTSMSSAVSLVETTRMDRKTVSIRYGGTFRRLAHWGTRGVLPFVLSGQLSLSLSSVHWCHRRLDLPWLMSCLSVV